MLWGTVELTGKGRWLLYCITPRVTIGRTTFGNPKINSKLGVIKGWYVRICLFPFFFFYYGHDAPDECRLGVATKLAVSLLPWIPEPGGTFKVTWYKEWSFVSALYPEHSHIM